MRLIEHFEENNTAIKKPGADLKPESAFDAAEHLLNDQDPLQILTNSTSQIKQLSFTDCFKVSDDTVTDDFDFKKLAADKFFEMIDREDAKLNANASVSTALTNDTSQGMAVFSPPVTDYNQTQVLKISGSHTNPSSPATITQNYMNGYERAQEGDQMNSGTFQYGFYFQQQQPNQLINQQQLFNPGVGYLYEPSLSNLGTNYPNNSLILQNQNQSVPMQNQRNLTVVNPNNNRRGGRQKGSQQTGHGNNRSPYFWQINSHTNTKSNLSQLSSTASSAQSTLSNIDDSCSKSGSSSRAPPNPKLKGRNLRASLAEVEMDRQESEILKQDVLERIPDPVKLIVLREKMGTINQALDQLQRVNANTPELKVMKKKEKNRLASKCCRLKKKALFEANLLIKNGLRAEKVSMQYLIENIRKLVQAHISGKSDGTPLRPKIDEMVRQMREKVPQVAGRTQEYVAEVIERTPVNLGGGMMNLYENGGN